MDLLTASGNPQCERLKSPSYTELVVAMFVLPTDSFR